MLLPYFGSMTTFSSREHWSKQMFNLFSFSSVFSGLQVLVSRSRIKWQKICWVFQLKNSKPSTNSTVQLKGGRGTRYPLMKWHISSCLFTKLDDFLPFVFNRVEWSNQNTGLTKSLWYVLFLILADCFATPPVKGAL